MTEQLVKLVESYILQPGYFAAFMILGLTFVAYFIKSIVFRNINKKLEEKRKYWWQHSIIIATNFPLTVVIFAVGLSLLVQVHADKTMIEFTTFAMIRQVIWVIFGAWSIFRFAHVAGEEYIESHPSADKSFVFAVAQMSRLAILVLTITVVLELYSIPISGVLAFGGVGAAAIALASKDLIANFFGGLMIYLDQPFKVGDWVRSPEKAIEGTVEYIGWRLTRIRTFDKRPLYVPNGVFSNIIVENPSRMFKRRIDTVIGIRYDDAGKLKAVLADLRQMLESHEHVDKKEQSYVFFNEFGPSSLNIKLRAHTTTTVYKRFLEIQEEIFFSVLEIIEKHGAECAFPTTTIHIPNEVQTRVVS